MDVGLAIGTGRGLDGEPDVGSGIQLSDVVEARGLDDILERAAGIEGNRLRRCEALSGSSSPRRVRRYILNRPGSCA